MFFTLKSTLTKFITKIHFKKPFLKISLCFFTKKVAFFCKFGKECSVLHLWHWISASYGDSMCCFTILSIWLDCYFWKLLQWELIKLNAALIDFYASIRTQRMLEWKHHNWIFFCLLAKITVCHNALNNNYAIWWKL